MRLEDLEQVVAIDQLSFTTPWPAHSYRFELLENEASMQWVAEAQDSETTNHVGAEPSVLSGVEHTDSPQQKTIVGMIVVWLIENEAHIATLAVHPDFRGRGIGKQLLVTALRDCTHKGATLATLEVRQYNEAAISLYRQFKFEIVGRRPHYYQDTKEDAILMTVDGLGQAYLARLGIPFNLGGDS
jgi:ribosomal-protein-alanine N-acetyltransferase